MGDWVGPCGRSQRGLLCHQHMKVWACHPGVRAELPNASLCPADSLLGLCCSGPWVCVACVCMHVCVRACMSTCVYAYGQPLSHMQAHTIHCVPFQWAIALPPSGSPTLVAKGAAGPWMCAHMVRVAFHSHMLINVCPLPALSRGILVTPGIRLTPSS